MVGVDGSSPFAPTNKINNLQHLRVLFLFVVSSWYEIGVKFVVESPVLREIKGQLKLTRIGKPGAGFCRLGRKQRNFACRSQPAR